MRQQDHESASDAEDSIWTVLPVALIVVLIVGIVTMGVMKSFSFGPSVGDVVVFSPSPSAAGDGMQRNDIAAQVIGHGEATCILNPATMASEGGSLVVERSVSGVGHAMMQVHWAGHRTSKGSQNCGASADLMIAPNDLLDLAGAAGGFGITHKLMVSSTTFGTVPTMLE